MIKNIASSFAARLAVMAITLAVVVMNAQVLGGSGQGLASLIQFGILLLVSVSSYIGGGAVVYLIPRTGARPLLAPVYLSSALVALLFYPLLRWLDLIDAYLIVHVCILGWLQSVFTFHLQVLVGHERIQRYNLAVTAQSASLALALVIVYFVFNEATIVAYLIALYVSFGLTLLVSALAVKKVWETKQNLGFSEAWKALWRYGKYGQTGNVFQLLTYRSPMYFLEKLMAHGLAAAGIFSIAFYAAEAVWSVGKSLSLVQHARIANSTDTASNKALTLGMLVLSTSASVVLVTAALIVPENLYLAVFGDDMKGLSLALLGLAPGIIANGASVIVAHHFSGTGQHRINTYGSAAGFGALLVFIYPLIEHYGIHGAALAASIGYSFQFCVLFWVFVSLEDVKKTDWKAGLNAMKALFKLN